MKETSVNMKFVRFGQVLTEVIEENRIQMRSLLRETGIKNERLYDIKKGIGDYKLSVYVKIVNALHELIPDEGKYKEAKRRLTEAAFDSSPT